MAKASIHLLGSKLFAYYKEVEFGEEVHITRSLNGVKKYNGFPPEVTADGCVAVALMSKDDALAVIASGSIPASLPKVTVDALRPVMHCR